jgi:hypothetical protein
MGYRHIVIVIIISAALAAISCSATAPAVTEPTSTDGVDTGLLRELQAELDRQLAERGTSAVKPITHAQYTVSDLTITGYDSEANLLGFTWTYNNPGDYDLNGEVNGSDLTKIAKYFRRTTASPDWQEARIADGDGNGEVNGGDIVSISANFGNKLHGFVFAQEFNDYDHNGQITITDITPFPVDGVFPSHSTGVYGGLGTLGGGPRTDDGVVPDSWFGIGVLPMISAPHIIVDGKVRMSTAIPLFSSPQFVYPSYYYAVYPYSGSLQTTLTPGTRSNPVLYVVPPQ